MKSRIVRTLSGATLLLILSSMSCASFHSASPPQLQFRTLRLSRDAPVLEYQYLVCTKEVLGMCFTYEMRKDSYDLRDDATRKQLVDMGFIMKVRDKP